MLQIRVTVTVDVAKNTKITDALTVRVPNKESLSIMPHNPESIFVPHSHPPHHSLGQMLFDVGLSACTLHWSYDITVRFQFHGFRAVRPLPCLFKRQSSSCVASIIQLLLLVDTIDLLMNKLQQVVVSKDSCSPLLICTPLINGFYYYLYPILNSLLPFQSSTVILEFCKRILFCDFLLN